MFETKQEKKQNYVVTREELADATKNLPKSLHPLHICVCGIVFAPWYQYPSWAREYPRFINIDTMFANTSRTTGDSMPELKVYNTYCPVCILPHLEKEKVVDWAKANPDKAKLCMEKHTKESQ